MSQTEAAEPTAVAPETIMTRFAAALKRRRELIAVVVVFLAVFVVLTNLKTYRIDQMQGDSAMFFQVTDNIAHRGVATSGIYQNIRTFRDDQLVVMPAERIASNPLAPPAVPEGDILRLHTYLVLYPLAAVTKILPVETTLEGAFVASFVGMLALAFAFVRRSGVPIAAALLFVVVVAAHGAWAEALLGGQFFPDRIFVLLGFAFMVMLVRPGTPRWLLALVGLLTVSVTERSGVIAGIAALAYVALYWRRETDGDRTFKLVLGGVMFAAGMAMLKFVSAETPYDTFIPHDAGAALAQFSVTPGFAANTLFFFEMSAPLLILALFEWRAAAIAVLTMLPNVFGTIGGGEKIGWSTHYHSYYLPILVWAATMGYVRLYRLAAGRRLVPAFYAAALVLALFGNAIDPLERHANVTLAHVGQNVFARAFAELTTYPSPAAPDYPAIAAQIRREVPVGSAVSSPEGTMAELYHDRTVHFFPIGIDSARYAIMTVVVAPGRPPEYSGVASYLGPEETAKANRLIVERMKKDGYDMDHPSIVPSLGVAILHRRQ